MHARCLQPSRNQCFYPACHPLSNHDNLTVLSIRRLQLFWAFLVGCGLHPTTVREVLSGVQSRVLVESKY